MEWLLIIFIGTYSGVSFHTFPNQAACEIARSATMELTRYVDEGNSTCVGYDSTRWQEGFEPKSPTPSPQTKGEK